MQNIKDNEMALLPGGSELVAEEIGWYRKGWGNGMAWWLHGYLTKVNRHFCWKKLSINLIAFSAQLALRIEFETWYEAKFTPGFSGSKLTTNKEQLFVQQTWCLGWKNSLKVSESITTPV